eukprot:SAG11_NODE_6585_length_1283_cov_1.198480_1_plen_133_part_10
MWLGDVERVAAVGGKSIKHMRGPSLMSALLQFGSGVTAIFEAVLAPSAIADQPFFVIQGSKGEIHIDGFEGGGRLYTLGSETVETTPLKKVGWDASYALELADFARAILAPGAGGPQASLAAQPSEVRRHAFH